MSTVPGLYELIEAKLADCQVVRLVEEEALAVEIAGERRAGRLVFVDTLHFEVTSLIGTDLSHATANPFHESCATWAEEVGEDARGVCRFALVDAWDEREVLVVWARGVNVNLRPLRAG